MARRKGQPVTSLQAMSIIEAMEHPRLFGPAFRDRETWRPWRIVLKALFGLPLDDDELALYRELTGRETAPTEQARESWFVCGRRAGKTFISSLIATFMAFFVDWSPFLGPGEKAVVMLLAADRRQARQLLRYVQGLIRGSPILRDYIGLEQSESIELTNGVIIEVHTASMRTVRGYSAACVVCDEISYWRTDDASANPDKEILNALRPTMATLPGSLLIGLSSPYRRSGVLWESYRDHYGRDGDPVFVVHGPSLTLNPSLPAKTVEDAYADDPQVADSEFGANFRTDVAGHLDHDWIERAVKFEGDLPPVDGKFYRAFTDVSGGGRDAYTLAISHYEDGQAIVDCVRITRPPFNPADVTESYAKLCKEYRICEVTGDRYAKAWVSTAWAEAGIRYVPSELTKSEIYMEVEPQFARGTIAIPRLRPLLTELRNLERRTMRSGKDQVDHPLRGSDDAANSVCGVAVLVTPKKTTYHEVPVVSPRQVGQDESRYYAMRMPALSPAFPDF